MNRRCCEGYVGHTTAHYRGCEEDRGKKLEYSYERMGEGPGYKEGWWRMTWILKGKW